jgi:hypothetical protein
MTEEMQKEELSIAYLQAVCAVTDGAILNIRHRDGNGVDATLTKTDAGSYLFDIDLHIQIKSTASKSSYREFNNKYTYDLRVKNYNDLVRQYKQGFLFLLILPEKREEWVGLTPEQLTLKRCMFFKHFMNEQILSADDDSSKAVELFKDNIVNPENLNKLFEVVYNELLH